jgi:lipopolysaccharide transport system ATP-binding protein
MFTVKGMCERVIYLDKGKLINDGTAEDVIAAYEDDNKVEDLPWSRGVIGRGSAPPPVRIDAVEVLDEGGRPRTVFDYGDRVRFRLHYEASQVIDEPNFVVSIIRSDNVSCCNYTTATDGCAIPAVSGIGSVELLTPPLKLVSDHYQLNMLVWDAAFQRLYCAQRGPTFHVKHPLFNTHFGVFHEPAEWSWNAETTGHREDARPAASVRP